MDIDPDQIIGHSASNKEEPFKGRNLSRDEIIRVQKAVLRRLGERLD